MTTVKHWDGAAWVPSGPPGPPGPAGVGDLLAIQREWGRNDNYVGHANGETVYCDAAKTIPLRVTYTPPVDAWWCVSGSLNLVQKMDTAYGYLWANLELAPADADGLLNSYAYEYQHATVQTFAFRQLQHTYKLAAGVAYSCTVKLGTSGGTWTIYQGTSMVHMQGLAYRR